MTQASVYLGNDPAALASYSRFMGRAPDNVLFYLNNDSWAAFESSIPWAVGLWKPAGVPVIWSVPLTVWGTALEKVATGAHDGSFLKAAQALATSKPSADGAIYVRVGWEFNGSWMPWAAEGREAAFISSFQRLVDTFRSVSDKFKFVWDANAGGNYDPSKAYPGDSYVDVVGIDVYYTAEWDSSDPLAAFQNKVSQPYGLQWQKDFAAARNKPTAISEWGVETDSAGPYIQAMAQWMKTNKMVFGNYWETDMANFDGRMHTGQYPNAAASYKAAIGGLQTWSLTNTNGWTSQTTLPRDMADVNGDGLDDIVGFAEDGVYVALSDGANGFKLPEKAYAGFGASAAAGGWANQDRFPREMADVNGDGRADIVAFANDGVYVALATGSGTFGAAAKAYSGFGAGPQAGGWADQDRFPREMADVNGDGRSDIVAFASDGVYVALANGSGAFGAATKVFSGFGAGPAAGGWLSQDANPRFLADVDSDGRADVVGFANDSVQTSLSADWLIV